MRILIAEDEPGISETYKAILEHRGHEVIMTSDGVECLKAYNTALSELPEETAEFLTSNPPFDAVILDYRMPNMDGLECARNILALNRHQRIIFASAYVLETLKESVKHLHMATELLQKPIELEDLADLVEDKHVYLELQKINVKIDKVKDFNPTHEQLVDLLYGLQRVRAQHQAKHSDTSATTTRPTATAATASHR